MTALSKSILSGLAAALVAATATFGWVCHSTNPNNRLPERSLKFTDVGPDYDRAFVRACLVGVFAYVFVFTPVLFRLKAKEEAQSERLKKHAA